MSCRRGRRIGVMNVAVIVMQAAELKPGAQHLLHESADLLKSILGHTGAIHPGIQIDEHAHGTSAPFVKLVRTLYQGRGLAIRMRGGNVADARRVGAHHRERKHHVLHARIQRSDQFQSGSAFRRANSTLHHAPHRVAELRGLQVRTPAVSIAIHHAESGVDVGIDHFAINQERRSGQRMRVRHAIRFKSCVHG